MTDWHSRAACAGEDPALWFPPTDDLGNKAQANAAYAPGKAVCGGCPVREECLAYALGAPETFGLWGGLDPEERRALVATGECLACGAPTPPSSRSARVRMYCSTTCVRTASGRRTRGYQAREAG